MKHINIKCHNCQKDFDCPLKKYNNSLKKGRNLYCSYECYNLFRITSIIKHCATCGKELVKMLSTINKSKTGNVYCNRSCAASNNNTLFRQGELHPNYTGAGSDYRKKKIKEGLTECERCGYNKYVDILEVHHKDCNRKNNDIANLELLCPTCHVEEHFLNKTGKFTSKINLVI